MRRGFLPVGGADGGLHAAWFGRSRLDGPSTAGAVLQGGGERLLGLSLESLLEEFATQGMAELHDQVFEISEGRAPRRSLGPIEMMKQVFGRGLQNGA